MRVLRVPALMLFLAAAMLAMSACVSVNWSPMTAAGSYDFGTVDANAGASKQVTFSLTNSDSRSSGVITVDIDGASAFTVSDDHCTGSRLGPQESCQVAVRYAPTQNGRWERATLAATGSDIHASLALTGRSGAPKFAWSPSSYDFGTVNAGEAPTETFTLTNTDRRATGAIGVSAQGTPALTVTQDGCSGKSLGNDESCEVTVRYAPAGNGQDDHATLTAAGSKVRATLALTGKSGAPELAWSPASYDFGSVQDGDTPTRSFTLANSGNGTSDVLTTSLTGSDTMAIGNDTCTGTALAPDGTCNVTVGYAPRAASTDSAVLSAGGVSATVTGAGEATPSRQSVTFTSTAPDNARMAGPTYTPTAIATSGLPVSFSIDASSSSVCAISDTTGAVNFIGIGACTLHADQAGNDDWAPAPQVTQTIQVATFQPLVVVNAVDDPQSPPFPPDPASNNCDPPTILGGGCFLNPLAGGSENVFDASGTIAAGTDAGFDLSLYDIAFHWEFFRPPGLGSAPYSSNGITGYHADVLDIQPSSLPELLGTDAGQDFYWRVRLTVTINGLTSSGFFKFQYQASTLSLKFATNCQNGLYDPLGYACQFAAANGLAATEPT